MIKGLVRKKAELHNEINELNSVRQYEMNYDTSVKINKLIEEKRKKYNFINELSKKMQ